MVNGIRNKCKNERYQMGENITTSSSSSSSNQESRVRKLLSGISNTLQGHSWPQINYNHRPPLSSGYKRPSDHPRKRALLCGVSYYKNKKFKLKGTINDVNNIKSLLICTFNFPPENIVILTEEHKSKDATPTKRNIQRFLKWLVADCQKGDSLVFYFSGHGLRQPDFKQDELDGFDETICPVDFMEEGMILDNEINSTIVQPLTKDVTLHAIIDACHSGTMLDLVHIYDREKQVWKDNSPPNKSWKGTNGGLAISISACEDDEVAADSTALTGETMNGVMTYILVQVVKKWPKLTYRDLLDMINEGIQEANTEGCALRRLVTRLFHGGRIIQKPQLSASEPFDVTKKPFIL